MNCNLLCDWVSEIGWEKAEEQANYFKSIVKVLLPRGVFVVLVIVPHDFRSPSADLLNFLLI